jgi:hypothetical protein
VGGDTVLIVLVVLAAAAVAVLALEAWDYLRGDK